MGTPEYVLGQELTGDRRWLILRSDASVVFRIAESEEGFAREIYENLIAGRRWAPPLEVEVAVEPLQDADDVAISA